MSKVQEACQKVCKSIWQTTKKNVVLTIVIAVVILAVAGLSVYAVYFRGAVGAEAAGQKAVDFVNANYLKDTGKAELKSTEDFSGMYKVNFTLTMSGQAAQDNQILYITRDGRYLFPELQGIPIDLNATDEPAAGGETNTEQITSCDATQKTEAATLEAFVVSNCPYGLQMQRILEKLVSDESASKQNVIVRYMGAVADGKITSMHGDTEAQENLRQICLRDETTKYWQYLSCYMKEGKSDSCLISTGVDRASLSACMTDANRGLQYAQVDFTLASQLGVQGSPTLFINGDKVDEFSFGGRTEDAAKSIICCGSTAQAGFCSKTLSKDTAATSFSASYAGASGNAGGDGGCGL